jgi:hypothetical protein
MLEISTPYYWDYVSSAANPTANLVLDKTQLNKTSKEKGFLAPNFLRFWQISRRFLLYHRWNLLSGKNLVNPHLSAGMQFSNAAEPFSSVLSSLLRFFFIKCVPWQLCSATQ